MLLKTLGLKYVATRDVYFAQISVGFACSFFKPTRQSPNFDRTKLKRIRFSFLCDLERKLTD